MSRDQVTVGPGTAVLSSDPGEGDFFTIHGIAIGSGDVTVGSSGVRKVWPEDELEAAAASLEGKPLVKDHENSVDGVIGRVTKTKFKPGTGILYEAEISEQFEDLAQKITDGLLEVSVRAYHAPTEELEEDEELDAKVVEDILFDNLAVVPQGAAPSNTANAGAAATMSASQHEMSAAELQAEFEDRSGEELSLHAIRIFGHVGLNEEFLDENSVDDVQSSLESHEALTVVFGSTDHDLVLVVDGDMVDSNEELDDHVVETLDDTPWEVWDDWSWLDEVQEKLSSYAEVDRVIEELAFHGPALSAIQTFTESEDGSMDSSIMEIREWSDSEHLMSAIEAYLEADGSEDDSVSDLESWIESDADDDSMSGHDDDEEMESSNEEESESDEISEQEEDIEPDDVDTAELKTVAGVTFEGTSSGKLDESEIPNDDYESHYLFPSDTKSDSSYPVVDAEGNLRAGNVEAAWSLGARGGVSEDDLHSKLRSLNNEFEDPPIDPSNFEEDSEESGSDQPNDSSTAATTDLRMATIVDDSSEADKLGMSDRGDNQTSINMDINYHDVDGDELGEGFVAVEQSQLDAVVEKAEQADELDSRLEEMNDTLSTLSEKTEILDEVDEENLKALRDHDDPVVKEREAYEADMDAVEETGAVFAELLADKDSIFTAEELQERNSPLELKAKYEELLGDDESLIDQLSAGGDPEPEGGNADKEELSDTPDTDVTKEKAREYLAREFESKGYTRQAEEMRNGAIPVEEYEDQLGVSFDE